MSVTGRVTNIQRCSTEDGPGIRTTVFLKGCPLHCLWCHNIETIDSAPRPIWHSNRCIADQACVKACPEHALELTAEGMQIDLTKCSVCGKCAEVCPCNAMEIMGREWDSTSLVEELARDKVFFETSGGGVTISGGEPLQQAAFAFELATGLRTQGIRVALDTTAYANEVVWKRMLQEVDLVLLDLKQMDPEKHQEYTGVGLTRILENARLLGMTNIPTWVRTPVIPEHTDQDENIRAIAKFIGDNMPNVERYDLLAFNKMFSEKYTLFGMEYPLKDYELVTKETMERLRAIALEVGLSNVTWSGMTKREEGSDSPVEETEVRRCGC
jgi:pyruvate formate lyase activating enzyme